MNKIFKTDIEQFFENTKNSPQLFNIDTEQFSMLKNIAIVQSFYGTNIERISATTNALKAMVQSTVRPDEWIFVEGQETETDCCFKWLKKYGILHKFVKLTNKQKDLFMKTPLWNIGASISKSDRLCFIDSDISFCNSSWLQDVNDQFDSGVQVMSLHGYSYHENQINMSSIKESIGHIAQSNLRINSGHYGFTIGMTRNVFNEINGFDCTCILDDLIYWSKITGRNYIENSDKWLPFKNTFKGYPFKCGSTEQVVCHCDHGEITNRKYKAITDIIKDKIHSFSDIIEYSSNTPKILPEWRTDTQLSRIIQKSITDAKNQVSNSESSIDGNKLYFENAKREFGQINDKNPLIIYTVFRKSFKHTMEYLFDFHTKLNQKCVNEFNFICFSDQDISEYEINYIPVDESIDENLDFLQIFRKDISLPYNSNVLFIPIDVDLENVFECCNIDEDDNLMAINEKFLVYFKYSKKILDIIQNSKKIGQNIYDFLYFNQIQFNNLSKYKYTQTL